MSDNPNPGLIATSGKVAETLIGGLSATPTLLLIVILNIVAMIVAGWYLTSQETLRKQSFDQVLSIISVCVGDNVRRPVQLDREGGVGHQ